MLSVPPHQSTIALFGRDGSVRLFKSMKAAYDDLGLNWIEKNVREHFVQKISSSPLFIDEPRLQYAQYVMRDDAGRAITAVDFYPIHRDRARKLIMRLLMRERWNGVGPVPGTGNSAPYKCYFRRMKTTAEKRWAQPILEDGEPRVRAKRSLANLPDSWDDYTRGSYDNRGWKSHRRQQHRGG